MLLLINQARIELPENERSICSYVCWEFYVVPENESMSLVEICDNVSFQVSVNFSAHVQKVETEVVN